MNWISLYCEFKVNHITVSNFFSFYLNMQGTPERRHVFLLDWVNSLDIPSCALVDSFDDL